MKISELIDRLNLIKKLHGDIPVQTEDAESFWQKDYNDIYVIRFDSTTNSIVIEA